MRSYGVECRFLIIREGRSVFQLRTVMLFCLIYTKILSSVRNATFMLSMLLVCPFLLRVNRVIVRDKRVGLVKKIREGLSLQETPGWRFFQHFQFCLAVLEE